MRKTFVLLVCIRMYPYVTRMLVVCIRMYPCVPYVTRMLPVCYPYVLVWCFSHDTRWYLQYAMFPSSQVSEHFLSNDHDASDMLLIPLELIKSNRDNVRKAREAYLIDSGQTLEPLGLNRRDET